MTTSVGSLRGSITPNMLAGMSTLELRARMLAEGLVSGMHRSPYRGFSIEFTEHRKYSQGDDLKHIDWKVYGRKDKFYVKQYEQETNLRMMLVVDSSESMAYRSDPNGLSKYEYAAVIAAAIMHLMLHQADAVGLLTFDDAPHRMLAASNRHGQATSIITELERSPGPGKTRIRPVLDALAEQLHRRHVVVILSDFFDNVEDILRAVRHLRHRKHEPILMQVLDHAELTFPFDRRTRFNGMEGVAPIITDPRTVRDAYLDAMQKFTARLRRGCHEVKTDFSQFDTSQPLDTTLSAYLAKRAHRD